MPTQSDRAHAFKHIETWANEAKRYIQNKPARYSSPALDDLVASLAGGVFVNAKIGERDKKGRTLVRLKVAGPKKDDRAVTRFMLPVHAALTRLLELSGAKIKLIRGSGGGIEKFYFDLKVGKLRTNLHRALFGMSSSGRLWERGGSHEYRYIVPSNYEAGDGFTRRDALAAISTKLAKQSKKTFMAEPAVVVSVLTTLFAIADHWHWDELLGRPTASDGERFKF